MGSCRSFRIRIVIIRGDSGERSKASSSSRVCSVTLFSLGKRHNLTHSTYPCSPAPPSTSSETYFPPRTSSTLPTAGKPRAYVAILTPSGRSSRLSNIHPLSALILHILAYCRSASNVINSRGVKGLRSGHRLLKTSRARRYAVGCSILLSLPKADDATLSQACPTVLGGHV